MSGRPFLFRPLGPRRRVRGGTSVASTRTLSAACGTVAPMSEDLQQLLDRHVAAGAAPGVIAIIGRAGETEVVTAGVASLGGGPMPADAIMRIQSMTKVISAVATLRLIESGDLGLDQPVDEWLPELADRLVLTSPTAALDDTVAADHPITVRHLLTNTSGYGTMLTDSPLQQAMADNGTEAGPEPVALGAGEWLRRLGELPLAFQPGQGWRYHHSFAVLGILIARVTGRPLGEHLAVEIFVPLGMADTALWVPTDKVDRLPAAHRHGPKGFVETEPAAGGFYAGPPPFDIDHGELVSTARDFYRFARALADDTGLISAEHKRLLTSDQVPEQCKTPDSFFPGFWDGTGWGFGVAVHLAGRHHGRYGWSGGLGTDFFVDPDATVGVLLTQVEMGGQLWPLIADFQELPPPR
jgi:CubicO group peptidase (beta-lactamase class C family)